ncbi:MAG TPA: altronate dehydratase [Saprospiraceae bacterium]|nr:altronate dehydratase [Saprospiraceae bacterium]
MKKKILKIHPKDNIIVALQNLEQGEQIFFEGERYILKEKIPVKHKFAQEDIEIDAPIYMYGIVVGKAKKFIPKASRISTENVIHATQSFERKEQHTIWQKPNISKFQNLSFNGYHRADGKVGIRNYWLVIPLVFCENRNIKVIENTMLEELGYMSKNSFSLDIQILKTLYKHGANQETLLSADIVKKNKDIQKNRLFPNVDGIKFLTHDGGCGGIRQDSETLCQLLAGYLCNANVAGATILSLGCQNAQVDLLKKAVKKISPDFQKPLFILEQQQSVSERAFIAEAVKKTFVGLIEANKIERKSAPLSKLCIGLECGGSDGFSGITANPALGYTSDLMVALGGQTILSEFPELNGVEQEIINRCQTKGLADKFQNLMRTYNERAKAVGSSFAANPSPGNIKDGLITDAMKSAGAAKKGGTSPVVDILDYTEQVTHAGLNLLCTPGNDVESTTGLAASGATIIVFTTGLGTPTGNPVAATIKLSTNNEIAKRMSDIIDINAGTIVAGEDSIESKGEELLDYMIKVANGEEMPKAEQLGQDDFIPWKRGVSL